MDKKTYRGRRSKPVAKLSISLSNADRRLLEHRIDRLGLRGPSEFVQRLVHQAMGARLPIVYDGPPLAASA